MINDTSDFLTRGQLTKTPENVTCGDVSNVGDINYRLDEMPNGDFVRECYMLTHDIIKALGNYATNDDKMGANRQFISAEKIIREYVRKSCKRALAQQQPVNAELLGALKDLVNVTRVTGINVWNMAVVEKAKQAIARADLKLQGGQ